MHSSIFNFAPLEWIYHKHVRVEFKVIEDKVKEELSRKSLNTRYHIICCDRFSLDNQSELL